MKMFKNREGGSGLGLMLMAVMTSAAVLAQEPPPPPDSTPAIPATPVPPEGTPATPGSTPAKRGFTTLYWGSFKTDKCTGVGLVQKSAILYGIKGSWEDACAAMEATIDGYTYPHPTRCVNTRTSMWGEFDVPDNACTPRWEGTRKEGCRGVGLRQYSATLVNIRDIDWNDACMHTPATIEGATFDQPARCRLTRDSDHERVQRGEFDVPDPSCGPVF